jgi:histidyl-tRNA synthetase
MSASRPASGAVLIVFDCQAGLGGQAGRTEPSQKDAISVKIDNSPARGNRDLLPASVAVRDHVLESITTVYRQFGYQRIETPALEDIARLQGGQGGENEKLIFQVLRRGLAEEIAADTPVRDLVDLGLRFDLTVPLTRFYGNNQAQLPSPFRSLQVGPVWRAERPQKGRYRQFYQCDIDLIGEPSVLAEAELIEATSQALAAVGLEGTTVRLSDRRFLSALAEAARLPEESWNGFFIVLDKLDKIGWDGVRSELEGLGLPSNSIAAALDTIGALQGVEPAKIGDALADAVPTMGAAAIEDLATTTACLDRLAADRPLSWQFDPTLVRGMGYYTGQIFELSHPGSRSSVAGGGRLRILDRLRADRRPARARRQPRRGRPAGRVGRADDRDPGGRPEPARRGPRGRDHPPQREVRRPAHPAGERGVQRVHPAAQ